MSKQKSSAIPVANAHRKNNDRILPRRKEGALRVLHVKKGDSLRAIYGKARRAFSAADLQRYTEVEDGIPLDQIIEEMETIQREEMKKARKKSKK
jgi:hypothetical protein